MWKRNLHLEYRPLSQLALYSANISKHATWYMVQRDQELAATKPWEKILKRVSSDLKHAPPTPALIPQ